MLLIYLLIISLLQGILTRQDEFLGCYENFTNVRTIPINGNYTPKQCAQQCYEQYYRYAMIQNENNCACTNFVGELRHSNFCRSFCSDCELKYAISDVYATRLSVPGPPLHVSITNITDTQLSISWEPPEVANDIQSYKVKATFVKSYALSKLSSPEWEFTNNTFQNELNSLHPGTIYNITVEAITTNSIGIPAFETITTQIGEPDHVPLQPKIIKRDGKTMKIKLEPVENNNGPITSYLAVVIDADSLQTVDIEELKSVQEANSEELSYYITAEIQPEKVNEEFTIGDGKYYGKYYNAPLKPGTNYDVILGLQSREGDITKTIYSNHNDRYKDVLVVPYEDDNDSPAVIIALSIAIGIVSCLLIVGLLIFFYLRQRINNRFRQRLQDVQELTLQGPMIDIENNGYISEDEVSNVNHYKNLKKQVWTIPQNLLNIQNLNLVGEGKFGNVYKGTVEKDSELLNVCVYSIADHKLNLDQKHAMLKDLDVLIKTGKHRNILEFIGTCENINVVSIVFEYATLSLKEFLIGSRIPTAERFTTVLESQAIKLSIDVARGMSHLHYKSIMHKKLCARHVVIVNGDVAKITGYGLEEFYKDGRRPNCIRWTAREVFTNKIHHYKSDVWSFACTLWEICTLGGTPYGKLPNTEIPGKITGGFLLPQLTYMHDNLYQILLNCWQLDLDERPTFNDLIEMLEDLIHSNNYLSFRLHQSFQYEPLLLEQELDNSVF